MQPAKSKRAPLRTVFFIAALFVCQTACLNFGHAQSRPASLQPTTSFSAISFEARGDSRLAGVWRNNDQSYLIAFLTDGRVASLDNRNGSRIKMEPGLYRAEGTKVKFDWLISGPESDFVETDGSQLILSESAASPLKLRLQRAGDSTMAASYYDRIYQKMASEAEGFMPNVPTAQATRGVIKLGSYYIPDPNPADIFPGANVYTDNARFQWVDGSGQTYERQNDNEPGLTCYSYQFLPNGRFVFDGWLYEVVLDSGKWVGEARTDTQRRDRQAYVRHEQKWGKYKIVSHDDAVRGETLEMIFSDGKHETAQVVSGREYMRSANSTMVLKNFKFFELEQARRRQR